MTWHLYKYACYNNTCEILSKRGMMARARLKLTDSLFNDEDIYKKLEFKILKKPHQNFMHDSLLLNVTNIF